MPYEAHEDHLDKVITFWDQLYTFIYTIRSAFDNGRPLLITIFEQNICFINAHMPHTNRSLHYVIGKLSFNASSNLPEHLKKRYMNIE